MSQTADRNLLLGVLALQMDFITREALIHSMQAWVFDKAKSLAQILCDQKALSDEERLLLEALVRKHIEKHGNDAAKSLAAAETDKPVRFALDNLADDELRASVARLPAQGKLNHSTDERGVADPFATLPPSVTTADHPRPRFRILREHARGGLGQVYVAYDEELHREVALKEIQHAHADDQHSRSRFLREAEITGGLEHPGVVPLYSLGLHPDGRPFYAMRLIRGETFAEAVQRFHSWSEAKCETTEWILERNRLLRRFIDVCNAVAYAHSQGIIHRDLKPANIMLGPFGEAYLIDWGLAKTIGVGLTPTGEDEALSTAGSAALTLETRPGSTLGTPQYMSPEQAAGRIEEVGPASDVYSLGATLYTCLTGHSPFRDTTLEGVLRKVQRGDFPRPREVNARVAKGLEAICSKAMALSPLERYPAVVDLAKDLESWLAGLPVSADRADPGRTLGGHMVITVSREGNLVYEGTFSEPVELGRVRDPEDRPYEPRKDVHPTRLPVAPREDFLVTRSHALLEPLPGQRVRLHNLNAREPIRLAGGSDLRPSSSFDLALPATFSLGRSVLIRVSWAAIERNLVEPFEGEGRREYEQGQGLR